VKRHSARQGSRRLSGCRAMKFSDRSALIIAMPVQRRAIYHPATLEVAPDDAGNRWSMRSVTVLFKSC
jgi:hypothetical protein